MDGKVVGRIEYHFYGCMQDGCRMAYVDWVYVLKPHRHQGIAQKLFAEFEKDADSFYNHFVDVELVESPILRKYLKLSL